MLLEVEIDQESDWRLQGHIRRECHVGSSLVHNENCLPRAWWLIDGPSSRQVWKSLVGVLTKTNANRRVQPDSFTTAGTFVRTLIFVWTFGSVWVRFGENRDIHLHLLLEDLIFLEWMLAYKFYLNIHSAPQNPDFSLCIESESWIFLFAIYSKVWLKRQWSR